MSRPDRPGRKLPKRARLTGGHVPAACPSGKRSYTDRTRAKAAAKLAGASHGYKFDVYRCTIPPSPGVAPCGQYHLTTRRVA